MQEHRFFLYSLCTNKSFKTEFARLEYFLYFCIQTNTAKIMYFIEKTTEFDKWFKKINDLRAKAKILFRLQKLEKVSIQT